jgi:hypothetical protein
MAASAPTYLQISRITTSLEQLLQCAYHYNSKVAITSQILFCFPKFPYELFKSKKLLPWLLRLKQVELVMGSLMLINPRRLWGGKLLL